MRTRVCRQRTMSWLWRCRVVRGCRQGAGRRGDAGSVSYQLGVGWNYRTAAGDWRSSFNVCGCDREHGKTRDNAGGGEQRVIAESRRRAAATAKGARAGGWQNDSLARLWRRSPSVKRSLPKSRPQTSSRAGSTGRATAIPLGRDCTSRCNMQGAFPFCLNTAGSKQQALLPSHHTTTAPLFSSSFHRRHPSFGLVHRVDTGLRAPFAPTVPCAQFWELPHRPRTPWTSTNTPARRRNTERTL